MTQATSDDVVTQPASDDAKPMVGDDSKARMQRLQRRLRLEWWQVQQVQQPLQHRLTLPTTHPHPSKITDADGVEPDTKPDATDTTDAGQEPSTTKPSSKPTMPQQLQKMGWTHNKPLAMHCWPKMTPAKPARKTRQVKPTMAWPMDLRM